MNVKGVYMITENRGSQSEMFDRLEAGDVIVVEVPIIPTFGKKAYVKVTNLRYDEERELTITELANILKKFKYEEVSA